MPIYMDRHDMEKTTAEAVAAAHLEDLKLQARYGCRAITYWFDEKRRTAFCLFEAPSPVIVREMHRAAHGKVPNGDLFGSVVNQTARICACAKPGQILASRVIRELCVGKKFKFSPIGALSLRGFPHPVDVDEIRWKE